MCTPPAALERPTHPVVLDVYTKWAGPCDAMQTVFKRLRSEHGEEFRTVQAVSDGLAAFAKYRNKSIPTFLFYAVSRLKLHTEIFKFLKCLIRWC